MSGKPSVCWLDPNGVQLEWDVGDKHLEIEIYDVDLPFLMEQNGDIIKSDQLELIDHTAVWQLRKMFDWVFGEDKI